MPPVDLENLVSACAGACNDSKITCETLADGSTDDETPEDDDVTPDDGAAVYADPDFPPESFWLSKDAEYDWFDRNAFYDRKGSGKGGNSNSSNLNTGTGANSTSNSQRFSGNLKSKAAMLGLPKTQKTTYVDSKRRVCKTANVRLFPKRAEPVGKSTTTVAEPGSPKVSCMGRVRSKRGRRRSNSSRRREKQVERSRTGGEKQKTGIYSKVMSMFRSKKGRKKPPRSGSRRAVEVADEEAATVVELQRKSVSSKMREIPVGGGMAAEPPGLGGVKRFVSGRRSGSWASEDFSQTVSGSLDSNRHVAVGVVSWS
ncbi:hypothetical protein C2S53_013966 [Perilla frutescens var. hirtella]|uniref:Uncharacterized protein n=1 Tax=Perilla frutescens var. hirtella TaxID=608512 RepID=A0AAD4PFZ2_PERFH|nr:hypothetical protein C2S53_013966 [Perilla frutescens var. hirtella]